MKPSKSKKHGIRAKFVSVAFILAAILGMLFCRSLDPSMVVFSNDGPYAATSSDASQLPGIFLGVWNDLNYIGGRDIGAMSPTITSGIRTVCWWMPALPVAILPWLVVGYGVYRLKLHLTRSRRLLDAYFGATHIPLLVSIIRFFMVGPSEDMLGCIVHCGTLLLFIDLLLVLNLHASAPE